VKSLNFLSLVFVAIARHIGKFEERKPHALIALVVYSLIELQMRKNKIMSTDGWPTKQDTIIAQSSRMAN
jgi:hypothetical protein